MAQTVRLHDVADHFSSTVGAPSTPSFAPLNSAVERPAPGAAPSNFAADRQVPSPVATQLGRPIVFGPPGRPLWGRLHETQVAARGAVVLCSPWGYEENCAFATFQQLAQKLAAAGYEVLRFDYDGCGNSFGDAVDPDRLAGWTDSTALALQYMARRTGGAVSVVGLRLGAALAVLASAECAIENAVLWDPVVSGKRYLRVLRAMSMMGVDAAPDPADPGSLVTIGNVITSATVADLEGLNLQKVASAKISHALIICRPSASDPRRLQSALSTLGVDAAAEDHTGTEKLLDGAAELSVIPENIVQRIFDFIANGRSETSATHNAPLPASVHLDAPDGRWVEKHLTLGSQSLAATLTLPRVITRQGVVLMTNNGVARSIGPARVWVQWARQLAEMGICSMRLDFSGLGDSGTRDGQTAGNHYPIEAIDDLRLAVAEINARRLGPAFGVGLCSGAFLNLDGLAAGVGLQGAVSINPQLFYLPDAPDAPHRMQRAAPPTHPWVHRFLVHTRVGRRLAKMMPTAAWRLLSSLGLQPSPIEGAEAAASLAPILLIYGDHNLGLDMLKQRDPGCIRRWLKNGQMKVVPGLDHSMFDVGTRQKAQILVQEFLLKYMPSTAN